MTRPARHGAAAPLLTIALLAAACLAFATLDAAPARAASDAAATSEVAISGAGSDSSRISELERKVNALTEEVERLALGVPADTVRAKPRAGLGLGPPASRVHDSRGGISIGGYGEMVLTAFDRTQQDGAVAGLDNRVDLLRAVLYVGHRFDDELLFDSELEWEHAGVTDEGKASVDSTGVGTVELSGEATVEFAFLEWTRHPEFGVRAGKLLVPVGLVNELHEPPVTIAALRPNSETVVIPSTWSEPGAGVFGVLANGISYRAYLMSGLDGARFSAGSAIREGRQGGSQSLATRPAGVVRIDWNSATGVTLGGSYYAGHAWRLAQPAGQHLDPVVRLSEIHGRLEWRSLDLRVLGARGTLSQSGELSDQIGLTGSERLGDAFFGGYIEVAYDVMPEVAPGSPLALLPYARYEESDTQEQVPAPGVDDPRHHATALTLGLAFRPHPGVALKAERQQRRDVARTATSQWNLSLGWMY